MNNERTAPHPLTTAEWDEVAAVEQVRTWWGLAPGERGETLTTVAYGARFDFVSPGYCGDLYVVQGDSFGGGPVALTRQRDGSLDVVEFD